MAGALLARLLSPASGSGCVLRWSSFCTVEKWFSKCMSTGNYPKKPMTAYLRFYKDQHPIFMKNNPGVSITDLTKKIALAWRELPASEKEPYEAAAKVDRQEYNEQLATYKAQLTPDQKSAWIEEKKKKMEKRKTTKRKRQTVLGKPKRPRSSFNIFMSEHFHEAKGASITQKLKNMHEEWEKLPTSQKQIYLQLAEDDKVRYANEIKLWEHHMLEIGCKNYIRSKNKNSLVETIAIKKTSEKSSLESQVVSPATNKSVKASEE
ncbi:transcription factor A, mitochondrial isoform X2 [Varanus komodoensis]|uniref:Transcription factor A, mitochondrial n=1 Tax=Varanus komodoensis TaxID=61221 RepID=A0A8D2KT42_VARKO|nr:transcription factor A, mitochondrial isoform X2 [Varanus komodoensis]